MNIFEPLALKSHSFSYSIAAMTLSRRPSPSVGLQPFVKIKSHCFSFNFSHSLQTNRMFLLAASHDDSPLDIGTKEEEVKVKAEEAQLVWEQTLAAFKEQSSKLQRVSMEAYALYSKKAMIILQETSEILKVHTEKSRQDLSVIAKEIAEESKEYLTEAVMNSPEPIKDVMEAFSSYPDELNDVSKVRDFYIGIPYGGLLSLGGFLSFMFTGNITAVRFGIILGGTLLGLSMSSLRSWKRGDPSSPLVLKGQTAIAIILFLKELRLLSMRPFIANIFTTIISAGVVAFYIYRIISDEGPQKGAKSYKIS